MQILSKINRKYIWVLLLSGFMAACSKETPEPVLPDPPAPPVDENPAMAIDALDQDIAAFMARFDVPGLSLAVTKNGKLVYAKGYGTSDKDTMVPVDTNDLFRIASLSKFITATGIMQFIESGDLSMDDHVFGPGAVLGTEYGTQPYPARVSALTIKDLLHHELGGWGNASSDPAFAQSGMDIKQLITWAIDNRPLTSDPGTKYAYSNMGFMILGQVIEKLSGQDYESYIKEHVMLPSGVKNMEIAGSKLADRQENEVKYYGQSGQNPYGYADGMLARIQAAGGWIASPIDLLRIMTHIDGFSTVPDILKPSTLTIMTTPSDLSVYACGLRVNDSNNWWHGGSLSGSRTWIVRAANGFCWSILTNTRSTDSDFTTALDRLVWPSVKDQSTPWPDVDLFQPQN